MFDIFVVMLVSLFMQLNNISKSFLIGSADRSQNSLAWVCVGGPADDVIMAASAWSPGLRVKMRVGVIYEHFQYVPDKFALSFSQWEASVHQRLWCV